MGNCLQELIEILTEEQELYRRYLGFLDKAQYQLIQSDEQISETTAEAPELIARKARELEERRKSLLSLIRKGAGLAVNLEALEYLSVFESPYFMHLESCKNSMLGQFRQLSNQNARNESLIELSIEAISNVEGGRIIADEQAINCAVADTESQGRAC
jgi:hypothetical protein